MTLLKCSSQAGSTATDDPAGIFRSGVRGHIAQSVTGSGKILFGQVVHTVGLAQKLLDEIIDCEHETTSCRCGDPGAYSHQERAAFELVYRCADMFTGSACPVAEIRGLPLPPRPFTILGAER
jgi:hypothetical protein